MKKITSILLSLCVLATTLVTLAVPAFAAEKDFKADYFPTGKIETPEAPYIKETSEGIEDTQLVMYYYQTSDLQKLALDIQKQDDFNEKYGIAQLKTFIQIDVKFNDGEWISTKGKWDTLNENHEIDYGSNIRDWSLAFLHTEEKGADNADKLLHFTQSWFAYFEPAEDFNAYLNPFVKKTKTDNDDSVYYFDFKDTTIAYRIRWCVRYLIDEYTDNEKWDFLTSDWSPETSIGKNGKQEELKMPERIEAPVLSEFKLSANEDGSGEIKYFASLPDSIYEAVRYQLIVKDGFEPYYIDAQVKINDGDWFTVDVANCTWIENGYKSSYVGNENNLKTTDDAWIRVRIANHDNDKGVTEWSNIIGTKAVEGESPSMLDGDGSVVKVKCKLCGICPVQPLNICLFIWIAIILVVAIVVIIIISKKKKNDKQ